MVSELDKDAQLQKLVMEFGSKVMFADVNRHHKKAGTKDQVNLSIAIFNGKPQLRVAYGKTFYNFEIMLRHEPQNPLLMLTGFAGVSNINKQVIEALGIDAKALDLRQKQLKFTGA
jgi:hypothetical protein